MATDADTQKAAQAIQEQLAAHKIIRTSTTATAAPPPANAETSNAETAAGASVPPAPAAVDAPTQG